MPRNIDHRVEVLFPLEDEKLIRQIRDEILAVYLADTTKARQMLPTGAYARKKPSEGKKQVNAQESLLMKRRRAAHERGKRLPSRRVT